uniref:Uncharacterized protein n=1 Tax=Geospiza parvula TaxID=87175 RepID=A0A8U8AT36_GEOPR
MALGVLAQQLGPHKRAVAYFSKQLDEVSKGWPGCLKAVAAVILNIEEARKLTLGQKMTVLVSHTVSAMLEQKGNQYIYDYVIAVGKHFDKNATVVIKHQPKQPDCKLHSFNPGDWVYVKNLLGKPLQEKWEGPFQVLLTTFTAVRIKE